ncbi:hypothetical protein C0995_011224, partial [Termitomyces sp. Mi166
MEEDKDEEGEAAQKLRKELEEFMVLTKFDNKLLASLLPPLMEFYKRNIELLQGAKILGGRKGDITLVSPATQALVLEKNGTMHGCLWNGVGLRMQKKRLPLAVLVIAKHIKLVQAAKAFLKKRFKRKGKAKALLGDSEQMGTKQTFKSTDLVDSNSDEEEEEERVHVIKKIKHEHVEELTGARKGKEIIELEDEGVPEPAAATPISKPAPVKSAGTEESGALIVNQVTKVAATQETLQDEDTSNKDENNKDSNDDEGGKGNDDDSNNNDAAMDIDS